MGEAATQVKYAAKGYTSSGKAKVLTWGKTPTGKVLKAHYDHDMTMGFSLIYRQIVLVKCVCV